MSGSSADVYATGKATVSIKSLDLKHKKGSSEGKEWQHSARRDRRPVSLPVSYQPYFHLIITTLSSAQSFAAVTTNGTAAQVQTSISRTNHATLHSVWVMEVFADTSSIGLNGSKDTTTPFRGNSGFWRCTLSAFCPPAGFCPAGEETKTCL